MKPHFALLYIYEWKSVTDYVYREMSIPIKIFVTYANYYELVVYLIFGSFYNLFSSA